MRKQLIEIALNIRPRRFAGGLLGSHATRTLRTTSRDRRVESLLVAEPTIDGHRITERSVIVPSALEAKL